jgi:hypothetical protein
VFGQVVLKRVSESKRQEVTELWRQLHSEELHNLCQIPDIKDEVKIHTKSQKVSRK